MKTKSKRRFAIIYWALIVSGLTIYFGYDGAKKKNDFVEVKER